MKPFIVFVLLNLLFEVQASVVYPRIIDKSSKTVFTQIGSNLTLFCVIEADPLVDFEKFIYWLRDDNFFPTKEWPDVDSRFDAFIADRTKIYRLGEQRVNMTLDLINAAKSDIGRYFCIIQSPYVDDTVPYDMISGYSRLYVSHPPSVMLETVEAVSATEIFISWTSNTELLPNMYYFVQYKNDGGLVYENYKDIINGNRTSYVLEDFQPNTTYYLGIFARNGHGIGPTFNHETPVTTFAEDPVFVPAIEMKGMSMDTITIGWEPPPIHLLKYIDYYEFTVATKTNESQMSFSEIEVIHPQNQHHLLYTFDNLKADTEYIIRARGCNMLVERCGNWSHSSMKTSDGTAAILIEPGDTQYSANDPNLKRLKLVIDSVKKLNCTLFSLLPNLEALDLSRTATEQIDENCFVHNPNLSELNLKGTPLKVFSFNTFSPKATFVDVHLPSKNITELDISCAYGICHLKHFDNDDSFENIRIFNVSGNQNQNISEFLKKIGPNDVITLDLSYNKIDTIDVGLLQRFSKLKHLNVSHSNVAKIEDKAFQNQNELISLDLSNNKLKDIDAIRFAVWPKLESLNIVGNPIESKYLNQFLEEWKFFGVKIDVIDSNIQSEDEPLYKKTYFICGLVLLVMILVTCPSLYAFVVYRRRKQRARAFVTMFEHGNINGINPELALDMQAGLLPYDKKFEFPRNKLKLGNQLGAGAFGIVLEATAQGIKAHEEETIVAVKMVKSIASNEVMQALVSELKVMIHLGQHLNVVNLLGAVTQDIVKCNLMIIVEYCPLGNLQSFLIKNRKNLVDQIVPGSDTIDTKLVPMDVPTAATEDESTTQAPSHAITTEDLLVWSFQIARGMDYLASRNIFHGDLAARNILLCDENVVKISDFGLARSLCNDENYHIKTKRCLPYKWLALETINDSVFSIRSDIWSFGVTMWELFSLGATPYFDIELKDLQCKLNDGYRLEKPEYATQMIHDIMLSCWCYNPEKRPNFRELEENISEILGEQKAEYYIDLNEPYLKANAHRLNSGETDYLALLKSPDLQAPSVPTHLAVQKRVSFSSKDPNGASTSTNDFNGANNIPKSSESDRITSIPLEAFKSNRV